MTQEEFDESVNRELRGIIRQAQLKALREQQEEMNRLYIEQYPQVQWEIYHRIRDSNARITDILAAQFRERQWDKC